VTIPLTERLDGSLGRRPQGSLQEEPGGCQIAGTVGHFGMHFRARG